MRFKIARDGYRFIIPLGLVSILCFVIAALGLPGGIASTLRGLRTTFAIFSGVFGLLGVACTAFFRDPIRVIRKSYQDGNHILSPADGTIDYIHHGVKFQDKTYDKISIFLSIFDVHVNRSPATGIITEIRHKPGRFGNAMYSKASSENERKYIYVTTTTGFDIIFVQIAGLIARRIVGFRNCSVGTELQAGERFGLIRFGSRMDVYLPAGAFQIKCTVGQKVKGGLSLLAALV